MKICISLGSNNGPAESPYTLSFMNSVFLYTSIFILILIVSLWAYCYAMPWVTTQTTSLMCHAAPNWNWASGVCK